MTVPDIPGVHSWGETMDEAVENTRIAIASHVETLLALGEDKRLSCSTMEELSANPDYAGAIWATVEVELPTLRGSR
ncbi:type II toxin-antitoxin system HicB family antitoxin [Burkholderia sp. JSH-S8]|nr:type II toxin-antitoxin system HicB family antitoxin [Burkholderia sp. JSH-S8]